MSGPTERFRWREGRDSNPKLPLHQQPIADGQGVALPGSIATNPARFDWRAFLGGYAASKAIPLSVRNFVTVSASTAHPT